MSSVKRLVEMWTLNTLLTHLGLLNHELFAERRWGFADSSDFFVSMRNLCAFVRFRSEFQEIFQDGCPPNKDRRTNLGAHNIIVSFLSKICYVSRYQQYGIKKNKLYRESNIYNRAKWQIFPFWIKTMAKLIYSIWQFNNHRVE